MGAPGLLLGAGAVRGRGAVLRGLDRSSAGALAGAGAPASAVQVLRLGAVRSLPVLRGRDRGGRGASVGAVSVAWCAAGLVAGAMLPGLFFNCIAHLLPDLGCLAGGMRALTRPGVAYLSTADFKKVEKIKKGFNL